MKFEIKLSSRAYRFLKNINKVVYNRIIKKVERLSEDPFPPDAKRVIGRDEKAFRVRVGDYRILYVVYLDKETILIINIDKRSKVYR
ncbi:MAG: type II toxin-antitoxin system RelE/ParE family toxin [Euryarchaeota archaeon]|nr:type II toxin-antitoxin system RelE/ParE family toxin [Euryarchaeota archaeon]